VGYVVSVAAWCVQREVRTAVNFGNDVAVPDEEKKLRWLRMALVLVAVVKCASLLLLELVISLDFRNSRFHLHPY